jgi:hypothetical protein
MNYNHNFKSNNIVKSIQPHLLQINTIIYIHRNYIDHNITIKWGDVCVCVLSENKRLKNWQVGVGQRRRGAMLSVQSKVINERFDFSWLPPDMLTGWPDLPKPLFINQNLAGSFF